MEFIKKYKNFLSDMTLNMIGFGIYIIAQQIILLPTLSKLVEDNTYSSVVLYISILNIVCNVTGGELGNTRLVRNSVYKEKDILGDFSKILVIISPIISLILLPIFLILKYSIIETIFLIATILMANIRLYSTCYYRLERKFYKVIIQNLIYLVGIIISLFVLKSGGNICLILFMPEVISLIYALKNSDLIKMKLNSTTELKNTVKKYSELGFLSFLTNLMSYFDKIFIYPLLGGATVAIYYAVNSMSKIVSLITNPMSSVILSWVSNMKLNVEKIAKKSAIIIIPMIFIVALITVPLTYISLRILYPDFVEKALILIIPISITAALDMASSLIKSILLKYCNTKKITISYITYLVVFIILGSILVNKNGLIGFAIANVIAKTLMFILFFVLLLNLRTATKEEK